jgi:hypothetical protein
MCADQVKKLPGLHKQGDVTLKRGAVQAAETKVPGGKGTRMPATVSKPKIPKK